MESSILLRCDFSASSFLHLPHRSHINDITIAMAHTERERETEKEMDSMEQQKQQAMAGFRRAESSRRAGRRRAFFSVVLSLLLVCLLVSLPSWVDQDLSLLLTGLPDCFWVDRKAMFLLCNLILAVIAMDSGLINASFVPEEDPCDEYSVREKSHRRWEKVGSAVGSGWPLPVPAVESSGKPEAAAAVAVAEDEEQQELKREQEQQQQQQEEEEEEEEEEEGVEEDGYPDMDELNKKFEDFIEKVKMERKLEALQLVWV